MALAVVTAAAAAVTYPETRAEQREAAEYRAFLDTAPAAQLEGEALSPDGQFRAETAGRTEHYISGLVVPEFLQVTDAATGEVLWQDQGWLTQSASWSPDSRFLALAYSTRIQSGLKIVDTETWDEWEFTLPDRSAIPEYLFFPEDWGLWLDEDTLRVTLGREAEERRTYRCSLLTEGDGHLTGSTFEEMTEALPGDWDFDHDGVPETTELVTVEDPEGAARPAWYELQVTDGDGTVLWDRELALAHVGWGSIFACPAEEGENLLVFGPTMYQGWAEYGYELLTFDGAGEAYTVDSGAVGFDTNFGRDGHQLDPEAIASFFWELRGYLQDSTLLVSTEHGEFQTGIPGLELQNYMFGDLLSLDSRSAMEAAVRRQEAEMKAEQGIA